MKQDNSKADIEKQADKAFKKGKEALTTGVFQWKKDYNLGAMHFEDAAKLYKDCKNYQKQKEALKLSIECNEKLNDTWAVGRNFEALIDSLIEVEGADLNELMQWTQKAGMYFKASESGMKVLQVNIRVIKFLIKNQKYDLAEQLANETIQEADEQQAPSTRSDIINLYVEISVETKQFYKASELFMKEIQRYREEAMKYPLNQYALIVVIMYILQDEIIRANSEIETLIIQVPNFHKSSEFRAADQMLNAYEKGDQNQFNDAVMKSCVTSIYPPNIVRQLRKVKVRVINLNKKEKLNQLDEQNITNDENFQEELAKKIL